MHVGVNVDALQTLLDEHRIIGLTIALLNDAGKKLQNGQEVPPEFFEKIQYVLRNFVDRCHHGKEEDALFPLVKNMGAEEAQAVSLLLEEHEKGRVFVRAMNEASSNKDTASMIKNISKYDALLIQHIRKENILFPTWITPLTEETKKEISDRFDEIEAKTIGLGKQKEYLQTVEELRKGNLGIKQ